MERQKETQPKMDQTTYTLLKLLVDLQETYHLIQSGIPVVCQAIEDLLLQFATELEESMTEAHPDIACFVRTQSRRLLISKAYTSKVNTSHKLKSLLIRSCGLVEPVSVIMAERFDSDCTVAGEERLVEKAVTAQVIPFKKSLEQLLNNKEVMSYVNNPYQPSQDSQIRSLKDGMIWKTHPVTQAYPNALLIQLYSDDLEITNPLGSRVKTHKLTNIYWSLINVPDYLRSTLKSINLIACVKSKYVKEYGLQNVLADFFQCLKALESEEGLDVSVNGKLLNMHGALISVVGDGLAQNSVGGFKEAFAFAIKPCRTCNFDRERMSEIFVEGDFRDWETHKATVAKLKSDNITNKEKAAISRDSGVKGESVFIALENFNPTKCFPHDIMHDLLEGVADVETRHLLLHFSQTTDKTFTIELLNQKIKDFRYPIELINSKPSFIEKPHLDNGLRQSASQMICLLFTLPFILSPFVNPKNEEHFNNFTLLVQITSRLLSYSINNDSLAMLSFMIDAHHIRYKNLYESANLTPKFHFLTHSISMIQNFGPIRNSWCMRFEGMNAWFSKSASATKNFINIEKSLACKFQIKRCAELGFGNSEHIFLGQHFFKPEFSEKIKISEYRLGNHVAQELSLVSGISPIEYLQGAKSVYLNNFSIKLDTVVIIEIAGIKYPRFGRVCAIFVNHQDCVLVLRTIETITYCNRKCAFLVKLTEGIQCLNIKRLPTLQPFPCVVDCDNALYVIPMYFDFNVFDG